MDTDNQPSRETDTLCLIDLDPPRCSTCSDHFDRIADQQFFLAADLNASPFAILKAAEDNCLNCRFTIDILNAVNEPLSSLEQASKAERKVPMRIAFSSEKNNYSDGRWSAKLILTPTVGDRKSIEIIATPAAQGKSSELKDTFYLTHAQVSGYTGSHEAVTQSQSWLANCADNHACCGPLSKTKLPTRLLRIKGATDVSLYESAEEEAGIYISLSHCWGRHAFLQTTSKTLAQHRERIPWEELPKTFQEAVSFTYRLGVEYLWIDSLCIIQDSAVDWEQEAARMSSVYAGSYLTLAAAVSPNALSGLFRTAGPGTSFCDVEYRTTSGRVFAVKYRVSLGHSMLDYPKPSLLMGRAWAFQERILSPRIVHFMEDELWYECCEGFICECLQMGTHLPSRHGTFRTSPTLSLKPDLHEHFRESKESRELQSNWRTVVEDYTNRTENLTYASDVFPALQGLAKIAPPSMGAYLAGLWETHLPTSLSWSLNKDARCPRPIEWRAPSWSWASVDEAVSWPHYHPSEVERTFIEIVRSSTVPKGQDPTGQLLSGTLVVKAQCLHGNVYYPDNDCGKLWAVVILETDQASLETWKGDYSDVRWDYNIKDSGPHSVVDGMPILAMRLDQVGEKRTWVILRLLEGKGKVYERIGLLKLDLRFLDASSWCDVLEMSHDRYPEMELTIV